MIKPSTNVNSSFIFHKYFVQSVKRVVRVVLIVGRLYCSNRTYTRVSMLAVLVKVALRFKPVLCQSHCNSFRWPAMCWNFVYAIVSKVRRVLRASYQVVHQQIHSFYHLETTFPNYINDNKNIDYCFYLLTFRMLCAWTLSARKSRCGGA